MKQYIDKDELVAEIKKHQAIWDGMDCDYCKGQRLAYSDILSFLDTLEVKEVRSSWSEEDETNLRRVEYACMKFFGGDSLLIGWLRKKIIATKEVDLEEGSMLK